MVKRLWISAILMAVGVSAAAGQAEFAVASIRPSAAEVKFEHDGRTTVLPGWVRMQDVTAATCIKWAYSVQDSQISGPGWLQQDHFDVDAKADGPATADQMKPMMQALLAERFKLAFHHETRELHSYAMTAPHGAVKLHRAPDDAAMSRVNSANGSVVKGITMKEWGDFIAGPLQKPVVDKTGLPGKYDFVLDFTSYLSGEDHVMKVDNLSVIFAAFEGELGLKLEPKKEIVDVMVIDHVEKPGEN